LRKKSKTQKHLNINIMIIPHFCLKLIHYSTSIKYLILKSFEFFTYD